MLKCILSISIFNIVFCVRQYTDNEGFLVNTQQKKSIFAATQEPRFHQKNNQDNLISQYNQKQGPQQPQGPIFQQQLQQQAQNMNQQENMMPQRQQQSVQSQNQVSDALQAKLLQQQKFQEKLLMQQKINEEVQRQVKEKLKIIEEQKKAEIEKQQIQSVLHQKAADMDDLIQKQSNKNEQKTEQKTGQKTDEKQEQKQEQKQEKQQEKQQEKSENHNNQYQVMDDVYFLKDNLKIKLTKDLNLSWAQMKAVINTSKQMVRTCGSGLKLCMTPLGSDLLQDFNLRIFDFTSTNYNEKQSYKNEEFEENQAFQNLMNDS